MADFTHLLGGLRGPTPQPNVPALASAGDIYVPLNAISVRRKFVWPLPRIQLQASAGSCVAHGVSIPAEAEALAHGATVQCCRMDLYYLARAMRGWEHQDSGCLIGDMYRVFREFGTVSEVRKAYNAAEVTTWAPPADWNSERSQFSADYDPLPATPEAIVDVLSTGVAVPYGHPCHTNYFNIPASGIIPPPVGPLAGHHCEAFVGYDLDMVIPGEQERGALLDMNSWKWGIPHPEHAATHPYAFAWVPIAYIRRGYAYDTGRLVRGLPVEV